MPRLEFYQDGQRFIKLALEKKEVTFGRSSECDVTLVGPSISRIHARIEPVGDRWRLKNLGRNGTRVNAELVLDECMLEYGDRIYIDHYTAMISDDVELEGSSDTVTLTKISVEDVEKKL